jgi:hypothetical protein
MTVDPRLTDIVHSLETLPTGNGDLVRFVPNDGDDRVADIVQSII